MFPNAVSMGFELAAYGLVIVTLWTFQMEVRKIAVSFPRRSNAGRPYCMGCCENRSSGNRQCSFRVAAVPGRCLSSTIPGIILQAGHDSSIDDCFK